MSLLLPLVFLEILMAVMFGTMLEKKSRPLVRKIVLVIRE
jgi:hypothetical protein